MFRLLTFSFFLLFMAHSNAQVWGNSGAKWHYKTEGLFSILFTASYVEDTTLAGFPSQKIRMTQQPIYPQPGGGTSPGPESEYFRFTRTSGDSVFHWVDSAFYLLYDFGANIGDTWEIGVSNGNDPMCDSISIVEVIDTGSMVINGMNLRTLNLASTPGSQTALGGKAVERIGMIESGYFSFLFPSTQMCDTNIIVDYFDMDFLCYEDDNFTTFKETSQECDYLLYLGNPNAEISFGIAPNPAEITLNVLGIHGDENYEILSLAGQVVLKDSFLSGKQIDLQTLEPGHYFIRIEKADSKVETHHFVKK